jgi:ribose transport system substrate-binding protein
MIVCIALVLCLYTQSGRLYKQKVFGVTCMTMNNPFYEIINNELLKQIESHNDWPITYDPLLDEQKQIEQVESLIAQKVDGIFINPVDYESLQPTQQKARRKNDRAASMNPPKFFSLPNTHEPKGSFSFVKKF